VHELRRLCRHSRENLKSVPGVSEAAVSLAERTASVSGTADAGR